MNAKRMTLFAVLAALIIAGTVFAGIYFSGAGETAAVTLPETSDSGADSSGDESGVQGVVSAEVRPETVQVVIKSLERPVSYQRNMETTLRWSAGESTANIELWVKNGVTRLDISESGAVKHVILTSDAVYVWYNDGSDYMKTELPAGADPAELVDELSTIPSYESVLKLDPAMISDANYTEYEGRRCVFVRAVSGELGYTQEYYIEVENGLLIAAAEYDGEKIVYEMKAGAADITAPEDSLFCLPGETEPVNS